MYTLISKSTSSFMAHQGINGMILPACLLLEQNRSFQFKNIWNDCRLVYPYPQASVHLESTWRLMVSSETQQRISWEAMDGSHSRVSTWSGTVCALQPPPSTSAAAGRGQRCRGNKSNSDSFQFSDPPHSAYLMGVLLWR